jgi:small-conductance mechanosensitive channel
MGIIYEEGSIGVFLLITVLLGGGAAWMAGRAAALTWRPWPFVLVYIVLLGVAVRFIHHALFGGTMFSFHYYIVDTIILAVIGLVAYRATRTRQMVTQYGWLYERTGPLSWRDREPSAARQ